MQLLTPNIIKYLNNSLSEDLGIAGDITSNALIQQNEIVKFQIISREKMVLAGLEIAEYFFKEYSTIGYTTLARDRDMLEGQQAIIKGKGSAKEILLLERVVLNYLQHLSGIATITNQYVAAISGTKAKICDTRKTIPGLRALQKYAVLAGGGKNHRLALDSSILIKDNHIAICGGITNALELAKSRNPHYTKIEIECDTLEQVGEAISIGVDIIMLDNMNIEQITEAVKIINGKALIEVSGGVNLDTVSSIAKTGIDFISIGRITHSAPAVDIGLDIG